LASQDDRKTWTPSTVRPASAAVPSSKWVLKCSKALKYPSVDS
jgi:hypothetical protein